MKPTIQIKETETTYSILAKGMDALRKEGRHGDALEFFREATGKSWHYKDCMAVVARWFTVEKA